MTTSPSSIPAPPPSALKRPPTLRERASAQLARLRPSRPQLVDAAFTVALVALALIGFRTTFFGLGWLWVGLAGLLFGLLISHATATYGAPGVVTLLAIAAAYLLLGGPVAVREDLVAGFLPSGATFATLVHMAVPGWKELLTALTPVDSEGPYLALSFLFGLVGSAVTYAVARRWRGSVVALVAPVALLVASIVLGTLTPAAVLLQGAVFALASIGWAAVRSNRNRPALQNGAGRTTRAVTTAALLTAATVGGFFIGPHLPGADDTQRTVFRSALTPPIDVTQFASPLAGFRQYTEPNPAKLWDRTLLRVVRPAPFCSAGRLRLLRTAAHPMAASAKTAPCRSTAAGVRVPSAIEATSSATGATSATTDPLHRRATAYVTAEPTRPKRKASAM